MPSRSWCNNDLIEVLSGWMVIKGCPTYLRSDNGIEITAKTVATAIQCGCHNAYIEPGSP